jgi:hypothetical protein
VLEIPIAKKEFALMLIELDLFLVEYVMVKLQLTWQLTGGDFKTY